MSTIDLNKTVNQLYPTGKAFNVSKDSTFYKLHEGLNDSLMDIINDGRSLFDSIFPDSENFTIDDVRLWEYHLGLTSNENIGIELRKDAILRKMTHPNNIKSRQDQSFLESQLQLAGFNVWVHENTPPYKTPDEVSTISLPLTQHSDTTQMSFDTQMGGGNFSLIANSSNENEEYNTGGPLNEWATFFIGGETLGDYVNIPPNRMTEFRELVLKLKPAHLAAWIFITNEDIGLQQELQYSL